MEHKLILSNCFIQAVKRKLTNKKGKIGYGIKTDNDHLYFFYEENGIRYRFARKIYRNKNKNRLLFIGYCYMEDTNNKRSSINDKTKLLF